MASEFKRKYKMEDVELLRPRSKEIVEEGVTLNNIIFWRYLADSYRESNHTSYTLIHRLLDQLEGRLEQDEDHRDDWDAGRD
jgi:hypothetical protein